MSLEQPDKTIIKRVILWSVIIGGILALFVPAYVQSALPVFAADQQSPCELFGQENCITEAPANQEAVGKQIETIIFNFATLLIYLVGAVSVLMIVYAAYKMIFSNGDSNNFKSGVDTLKYAVIGLVIAILSFGIEIFISSLVINNGII